MRAAIEIGDDQLAVYNVHLSPPLPIGVFSTESRSRGLSRLLASAANNEPALMIGDFNMTDRSEDYQRISHIYQDTFRLTERGLGTTFPNGNNWHPALRLLPPMIRIDYIFASDTIIPLESHVIRQGVSDHYPLWARLGLGDRQN